MHFQWPACNIVSLSTISVLGIGTITAAHRLFEERRKPGESSRGIETIYLPQPEDRIDEAGQTKIPRAASSPEIGRMPEDMGPCEVHYRGKRRKGEVWRRCAKVCVKEGSTAT